MLWAVGIAIVLLVVFPLIVGFSVWWWAGLGCVLMVCATTLIQWIFDVLERAELRYRPRHDAPDNERLPKPQPFSIARLHRWLHASFAATGGTIIGWLERCSIFLAVSFFAEPWVVVGAIIGFKSIGRYPEILAEQHRDTTDASAPVKFVEKFLIGTAVSVILAVSAGLVMRMIILPYFGLIPLSFTSPTSIN